MANVAKASNEEVLKRRHEQKEESLKKETYYNWNPINEWFSTMGSSAPTTTVLEKRHLEALWLS